MPHYLDAIEQVVTTWEHVSSAPHRFNAVEFNLDTGKRSIEIGHLHDGRMLDILYSKKVRDVLLDEGKVSRHQFVPDSGWTSFTIQDENDIEHALWLLRLSYLQKVVRAHLSVNLKTELANLEISDALREVTFPLPSTSWNDMYFA